MPYAGFYINLDDSADRRAEIEVEIARFGLQQRYRRFAAIKGNALGFPNPKLLDAEIGCFTSHCLLLQANIGADTHLHVVEDDVVFSRFTDYALRWAIEKGTIDQLDVLFTDTFITPLNNEYRFCKELYDRSFDRDDAGNIRRVRPRVVKHIAGTSSYLVNRGSIGKLVDVLMRILKAGARTPLDITLRGLADKGVLRTGALFPFVTSVRLPRLLDTTLAGRTHHHDLTSIAAWLGRNSFFVDCDMQALVADAERLLPIPDNDLHCRLLARILSFSLTDKYRPY